MTIIAIWYDCVSSRCYVDFKISSSRFMMITGTLKEFVDADPEAMNI